jgi:protein involved in polysaccharide export with SLBB domain
VFVKGFKFAALALAGLAFAAFAAGGSTAQAAPAVCKASDDNADAYRLDTGDKVRVTTFAEPTMSGEFVVDGQGVIALPLAGEVPAKNLTVRELERSIEKTLIDDQLLRHPQVSAEVISFRPFFILGEVTKPGEYPYSSGLTVMRAIATAGDFTYRANKNRVFIKSVNCPEEKEVALTPSTQVHPGDTIRIKERFF